MSAVASLSSSEEVITSRRTESLDAHEISKLITPSTTGMFGRINVLYLLEKSNLAVSLENENKEIVAHAAFLDYPNHSLTDPAEWVPWIQSNYKSNEYTPLNTLFMHLFVAQADYALEGAKEIIRTVFNAVPELHYIFLFIPSTVSLEPSLEAVFEPVLDPETVCQYTAFIAHRHLHFPVLRVRKARVEDHDDLIPLFTQHNSDLSAMYGDYFLAELIEAQNEQNHAVVCEVRGKAVGFMSVCSDVNVEMLNQCFNLKPFHGLYVPDPADILEPPPELEAESAKKQHSTVPQSPEAGLSQEKECNNEAESDKKKEAIITPDADIPAKGDTTHNLKYSSGICMEEAEKKIFHPVYKGSSDAFCIQLFVIDEKYEMRSQDFLPFVFKLFPNRDFCVITVPNMVPEFPLLQSFARVIPYHSSTLPQDLYVFHRSGLISPFIIRKAKSIDKPGVECLISKLRLNKSILENLNIFNEARRHLEGTPVQAFVAEVMDQIVGIGIIKNEEDINYIRSHYNIEDFIYFSYHTQEEHGRLLHFALNPIFHHHRKHFLKEILRLSYKSCIYHTVNHQQEQDKNAYAHSLTSALNCMVPVCARRQIVYPLEELGINAPSRQVSKDQVTYALYHFNRKLTFEPKVTINARIVIVGASDTGIACLEKLIFRAHLKFNNITLISTHGIPTSDNCDLHMFLASSHCYNDKDYALLSPQSWVNVVIGKMKRIDRAAKHVVLSEGRKVPYDHLILCTGEQYQVCNPTGVDINKLLTNRELSVNLNQIYTGQVPSNLFTIKDKEDCLNAYIWLQDNFTDREGNVIVYGNTLDAYTTVEALLSLGVMGSRIHLVEPPLETNVTCFNNFTVESAVDEALKKSAVTVYKNGILAQWNDGNNPEPIMSASFTTDTKPFKLPCSVFINFYKKKVAYETFKAINDACLVYDGKLVIDSNFHTNDPAIRAAGPLTKFAQRYHADGWSHSIFNSKEVGYQLATILLPFFDPTLPVEDPPEDPERLIPMYPVPKIQGCKLPGGYYYLHVAKPGLSTPLAAQMSHAKYGTEIITGSAQTGNYFRLHLNQYSMVETITCLSTEPFPSSNYICLYGQNEQLLNRLCDRLEDGLITDLYSYFKEPWCLAIYHDRFNDFKSEVHQIMSARQMEDSPSVTELIQQVMEEEHNLSSEPKEFIRMKALKCGFKRPVEKCVLNYLKYNSYHLSMYALPGLI
ncbi:cilia- and flagella-associated protein 61 [Erpetoichthys calabaricus]|nr:cilia- and flagella-associated protein 61 [Erpetoichthys calabaricus]